MSRSDLVRKLAQASARGDHDALQRTMNALINEARDQQQHSFAERLVGAFKDEPKAASKRLDLIPESVQELVVAVPTRRSLSDIILHSNVREEVDEFVYEFKRTSQLRAHSLEPRHTVLLVGPPGNGKTSLAEALAHELSLPLLVVRYDAVIDSYLGETASRLRRIVDFASGTPCILFFDEFDAVGKERGDSQETGEIKRVVSSLLVQMDAIPSHSIIICATNHPELLDRAVWRRFELRLDIGPPGERELGVWYDRLQSSLGADIAKHKHVFMNVMMGQSFSEIEAFTLDLRRKIVLSMGRYTAGTAMLELIQRWASRVDISAGGSAAYGSTTNNKSAQRTQSGKQNKVRKTSAISQKNLL